MTTADPTDDWVPRETHKRPNSSTRCDEISHGKRRREKEWMKLDMNECEGRLHKVTSGRNSAWSLVRHGVWEPWAGWVRHLMTAFQLNGLHGDMTSSSNRRSQFAAFANLNGELLANCVAAALFRSSAPETYIQLKDWNFCWCPIMRGSECVCVSPFDDVCICVCFVFVSFWMRNYVLCSSF